MESMGARFIILTLVFGLYSAPAAQACRANMPLTETDIAFPEIIFEGRLQKVETPNSDGVFDATEYVFDVTRLVKGNLPQQQITIGLTDDAAYSAPKSIGAFAELYGDHARIAITTPEQIKTYCSAVKNKRVTYHNGERLVTESKPVPYCETPLLTLDYPRAKEIPFVLRPSCAAPYIFAVEAYEKRRNYEANLKLYEERLRDLESSGAPSAPNARLDLFNEITGGFGPLPWARP